MAEGEVGRGVPAAKTSPAVPGERGEGTPTQDAEGLPKKSTLGIFILFFMVNPIPILAPFPDIAMHVMQAPGVSWVTPHRAGFFKVRAFFGGAVGIVAIAIRLRAIQTIRRFFQRLRVMRCLLAAGALSRATVSCRVHGFLGHVIPVFGDRFRAVVARRWLQLGKPAEQEEKIKNRIQTQI